MELTGKWVVATMLAFTDDGMKQTPVEEIDTSDSDMAQMASSFLIISDEKIETCIQLPAEVIEEARADGAPVSDDGVLVGETYPIKIENGTVYYNDGSSGMIMDNVIDGWNELKLNEAGFIDMGMACYKKA